MWVKLRAPHKHQTKSKVSLEGEMKPHYHQHHIKHGYFHLRLRYEKKQIRVFSNVRAEEKNYKITSKINLDKITFTRENFLGQTII